MKINIANYNGLQDVAEVESLIGRYSAIVKEIAVKVNGSAYFTMLDAMDKVRALPIYRQEVKARFNAAMNAYGRFVSNLLHPSGIRLFCVRDIPEQARRKYKPGMTDREYYGLLMDIAASSYDTYRKEILVLQNKFRKALLETGHPYPAETAWALSAETMLTLAAKTGRTLIKDITLEIGIPNHIGLMVWGDTCIDPVAKAWTRAVDALKVKDGGRELSEVARRDVDNGCEQLMEAVMRDIGIHGGILQALDDNQDLFASRQAYKEARGIIRKADAR